MVRGAEVRALDREQDVCFRYRWDFPITSLSTTTVGMAPSIFETSSRPKLLWRSSLAIRRDIEHLQLQATMPVQARGLRISPGSLSWPTPKVLTLSAKDRAASLLLTAWPSGVTCKIMNCSLLRADASQLKCFAPDPTTALPSVRYVQNWRPLHIYWSANAPAPGRTFVFNRGTLKIPVRTRI